MNSLEGQRQRLLEAALREQLATGCPGAILEIRAPNDGFAFSSARGFYARNSSRPLHPDDAFRAASVTKAVTAATAICLAANQYWSLDDPVTKFLPIQLVGKLRNLKGLSNVNELTIRRLLGHTSGLPDYFFDETLFSHRWLTELMNWKVQTRWRPHSSARYIRYGLGLGTNMAYGEEIIGATGVWGAFAYYWPAGDTTIAGTLNLVGADRSALMDAVIGALKRPDQPHERVIKKLTLLR